MSESPSDPVWSRPLAACHASTAAVVALLNVSSTVIDPPKPSEMSDCSSWRTSGPSVMPAVSVRHIGRAPTMTNALGTPSISTSDWPGATTVPTAGSAVMIPLPEAVVLDAAAVVPVVERVALAADDVDEEEDELDTLICTATGVPKPTVPSTSSVVSSVRTWTGCSVTDRRGFDGLDDASPERTTSAATSPATTIATAPTVMMRGLAISSCSPRPSCCSPIPGSRTRRRVARPEGRSRRRDHRDRTFRRPASGTRPGRP